MSCEKRIIPEKAYIVDTSVPMINPTCVSDFGVQDIYIPDDVIEELDHNKEGNNERNRNARETSRNIDSMLTTAGGYDGNNGISRGEGLGNLFLIESANTVFRFDTPDNRIISTALEIQKTNKYKQVIVVSKDINARIKAQRVGLDAEDYKTEQLIKNIDHLYAGVTYVPDLWALQDKNFKPVYMKIGHRDLIKFKTIEPQGWLPNEFIHTDKEDLWVRRVVLGGRTIIVEKVWGVSTKVLGIKSQNYKQTMALSALLDPSVDFVALIGKAGTGKTLLTLAVAMLMTDPDAEYDSAFFTRATVPVGNEIGFIPGTEQEKMAPWTRAFYQNMRILLANRSKDKKGGFKELATKDVLGDKFETPSISYMRGTTFLEVF